jgi:hypothetical protein
MLKGYCQVPDNRPDTRIFKLGSSPTCDENNGFGIGDNTV